MKKIYYYMLPIIMFSVLFNTAGCGRKGQKDKEEAIPVGAVKTARGDIAVKLFYVGDIKARYQIKVYPKVTGKLLENVVKEQNRVKKGDVIAYIDRDEIGFEFEKAPVESPINGIVGNMYLDKGEDVTHNTVVAQIVDMDVVEVRVNVVERDLPRIKEGQSSEIMVDAYPDGVFKGSVERVSPVVDINSRTALVEIKIPNDNHRLKPGMFARIKILIDKKEDALIIPQDAIIKEDSSNYVFVVKADSKAHRQKIEVGLNENNRFEVIKGLGENELVVTMGNVNLKEGDLVEVVSMPGVEK